MERFLGIGSVSVSSDEHLQYVTEPTHCLLTFHLGTETDLMSEMLFSAQIFR
jgi:hypothetical protein